MTSYSHGFAPRPGTSPKFQMLPSWPTVSIILLLVLSSILQAGLVTIMNVCLVFLAFNVWSGKGSRADWTLLKVAAPFFGIAAIGMLSGLDAERYLYLKDLWYITNPAIVIIAGYALYYGRPDVSSGLRAFVFGGTVLSLLYLVPFALHPELLLRSPWEVRTATMNGFAPVLGFMVLIAYWGRWMQGLRIAPWFAGICLTVCLAAMVVSFSRTILFLTIVGIMAATGAFARREWRSVGAVSVAVVLTVFILRATLDIDSLQVSGSFLGKMARVFDELTIQEYSDIGRMSQNWRGFETARALKLFSSGNPAQWLFGQGLGSQVGLGEVMLGNIRSIPILHNGYAYLLVKAGLVALLLYGFVIFVLYHTGRALAASDQGPMHRAPARILQATAVTLAFTTWVISGPFNKAGMFPFLLLAGFLLGALRQAKAVQGDATR